MGDWMGSEGGSLRDPIGGGFAFGPDIWMPEPVDVFRTTNLYDLVTFYVLDVQSWFRERRAPVRKSLVAKRLPTQPAVSFGNSERCCFSSKILIQFWSSDMIHVLRNTTRTQSSFYGEEL